MESKELPTIAQYFDQYAKIRSGCLYNSFTRFADKMEWPTLSKHIEKVSHEYAVLFARHHIQAQSEAIKANVKILRKTSGDSPLNFESVPYVDLESIDKAYPAELIK